MKNAPEYKHIHTLHSETTSFPTSLSYNTRNNLRKLAPQATSSQCKSFVICCIVAVVAVCESVLVLSDADEVSALPVSSCKSETAERS